MKSLPDTRDPLVVRTDYEHQHAWEVICQIIRAPVHEGSDTFYAYLELLEDSELRDLTKEDLLA